MKHMYFIYGNQHLEIEEEIQRLVTSLLPENAQKEAFYTFDTNDFFSKDQNQNRKLLNELSSTCNTVSFFSPVILVHIRNIQNLPSNKKAKQHLAKELEKIVLVKKDKTNELDWHDADTLTETQTTHFRITARQLVKSINKQIDNSYSLSLEDSWKNRKIICEKGNGSREVTVQDFLKQKLQKELNFVDQQPDEEQQITDSNDFQSILIQLLGNPSAQVKLAISANIKNTRELNQEVYALLKKNSHEIKKTISYDDFRPIGWIIDRARTKGLYMDQIAADFLVEIAGSDFSILDMELEKLSLRDSPEKTVTPDELIKSVSHSKKYAIFRVTDFLAEKDLKNSLECLKTLLNEQTSDHVNIFALISAQYRRLLKISWMVNQDYPEKMVIDQMKLNPWIAKQLIQKTRKYTATELENIVVHLSRCDLQLKYSSKQVLSKLENICYLICQNGFRKNVPIESHWLP
ncbi:DNA polymerase III subunit delta [bacterium]|nr:DNA polymerase III subunit delta [bacterium]